MGCGNAFVLLCLSIVVLAAVGNTQNTTSDTLLDAIVVGGGPAGLSALSGLARVRRKVLMVDSGVYRNNATRLVHDIIALDGTLEKRSILTTFGS